MGSPPGGRHLVLTVGLCGTASKDISNMISNIREKTLKNSYENVFFVLSSLLKSLIKLLRRSVTSKNVKLLTLIYLRDVELNKISNAPVMH